MSDEVVNFCTFEAAGRLFGVPLMDIKEVTAEINCTAIPHAQLRARLCEHPRADRSGTRASRVAQVAE